MFTVIPTADQITRARRRERFMVDQTIHRYGQEHLNNSILEGEGTIYGLVLEEIIRDIYLWRPSTGNDIFHYDLYDPLHLGRIEVKTKRCTSAPQFNYNCTVSAANYTQRCDYYLFSRIHVDFSKAYIIGLLPAHIFREPGRAVFARKGEEDPQRPGWQFKWDCYNIEVADLWPAPPTADYFANFKYRPAEKGIVVCN
jgi:hypothetical protein